eukprot:4945865-Pleurochrysis_carterae.AAC.1
MSTTGADDDASDSEAWLTGGADSEEGLRRAAALHTAGIVPADADDVLAEQLARFTCGVAGAHDG